LRSYDKTLPLYILYIHGIYTRKEGISGSKRDRKEVLPQKVNKIGVNQRMMSKERNKYIFLLKGDFTTWIEDDNYVRSSQEKYY